MKKAVIFLTLLLCTTSFSATTETVETSLRPWNGYWWPFQYGGLCTGEDYNLYPSPMEKYDSAFNNNLEATKWEIENHYKPDGESWWGHCNGWAVASILEPEPSEKKVLNSIVFYVGDQKGLLTECHQGAYGQTYGTRYTGDNGDEAYNDINPLDFQNVLESYLKDNDLPILIDADPSPEIWTYPVFKYEMSYTDDTNIRHVTLTIYCATDIYNDGSMDPDDFGDDHVFTKTYTYDLTLDSNGNPIDGVWTGTSVDDHPDFAWYPDTDGGRNPYVSIENVYQITSSNYNNQDDADEPNDSFEEAKLLDTNKIYRIENNDYFKFFIEPGENTTLKVYYNDYFYYTAYAKLFDTNQNLIKYFDYDSANKYSSETFSTDEVTDYFLEIEYPLIGEYQDNYQIKAEENYTKIVIPHTLETSYWDNFVYGAFIPYTKVNDETEEETEVTEAQGSLVGVFPPYSKLITKDISFNAGFKEIPILADSNVPSWIKLNTTDTHVKLLSFYQSEGEGSMGYFYSQQPAKRFILPHVPPEINYWWYGLVLVNPSHFKSISIKYKLYDYSGQIIKEGFFQVPQYGKIVDVFENLFPDVEMDETSYMEFSSKDPMIVSALYGTRNHNELAYVPADSTFVNEGETVYVTKDLMPQTGNPWAGIAIVNPSDDKYAQLYISVIDNNMDQFSYSLNLSPHEKKVDVMENFLPDGVDFENVERINITVTNGYISLFALYGDHDKGMLASYLPPRIMTDSANFYFPYITSHNLNTTLYIKNESNYDVSVTLTAINENGEEIETRSFTLDNFELRQFDINSTFSNPEDVKTIKVFSSRFITPFEVLLSNDEKFYEIIGPDFQKEKIIETQTQ